MSTQACQPPRHSSSSLGRAEVFDLELASMLCVALSISRPRSSISHTTFLHVDEGNNALPVSRSFIKPSTRHEKPKKAYGKSIEASRQRTKKQC